MKLRDYQEPVVDKATTILYDRGVCLLALECRLGKTFVSLSVADRIGARNVLFITPKKAIPSIQSDYEAMLRDNPFLFSITIVNPESILATFKKADKVATQIVSANYPSVSKTGVKFKRLVVDERTRQLGLLQPYMAGDKIDLIIVDECHRLGSLPKPCGSQQVIRQLARGKKVILLSGTPNPESHAMFFHEFQVSDNSPWSAYKNFYAWAKDYVDIKQHMVNGLNLPDYTCGNEERIMSDIRPYIVTLTQRDAGFDTYIDEVIIRLRMSKLSVNLITHLKRERALNIERIPLLSSKTMLPADPHPDSLVAETAADLLNKIHQLSGGTIKIGDDYYITDTTKADYLATYFRGRHYAIFYVYKTERDLLRAVIGSSITEDWQQFQSDPSSIFIGQIRSVREGIRLDTAEFSVFYSTEYSYVSYAQGINRIVSKERDTPAKVYFMTSDCKIEQMILDCVHDKKDFTLATYNSSCK